jgi:hypothetical protein
LKGLLGPVGVDVTADEAAGAIEQKEGGEGGPKLGFLDFTEL